MPEVTSDERGRRVFQIHKEKAAEDAIGKIRKSLSIDWTVFNSTDVEALRYILEETWVSLDRDSWEKCAFSRLKRSQVDSIIRIGKQVKRRELREDRGIEEVSRILSTMA
ncbi:MAG TPA: hypothetical protein VKO45_07175 [Methanomicrobiales archaeon]|nr:hypothetical protein [Methanomicrobiales archaeon]